MANRVVISICGEEYTFVAEEAPSYMQKVGAYVNEKMDEILTFILHDLHSGATLNEIIGAYDNTPRREMIAIVDKQEYVKLMDFIRATDPKAFVTVYSVSEISYVPKK